MGHPFWDGRIHPSPRRNPGVHAVPSSSSTVELDSSASAMGEQKEPQGRRSALGDLFSTFSRRRDDDHPSQLADLRIPSRFQVKQELGRGGMGAVYLAYDRRSGHDVALKILHG